MLKAHLWILCFVFIMTMAGCAPGHKAGRMAPKQSFQITPDDYRCYDFQGREISLEHIVREAFKNNAVFIGEEHDNAAAHYLEKEIFKSLYDMCQKEKERSLTLSMEMFEKDIQIVIDEYLKKFITERHFLKASRPWPNYRKDYRPLIEFAREKEIYVLAANAPARYVNMVARNGEKSLYKLSDVAKKWLPPLPYKKASPKLEKKFKNFWETTINKIKKHEKMAGSGKGNKKKPKPGFKFENMMSAQSLWDASMAYSIARRLKKSGKTLVLNINGKFHSEQGLGIVEHLKEYMPSAKIMTITILKDENFKEFHQKLKGYGDFIILTKAHG